MLRLSSLLIPLLIALILPPALQAQSPAAQYYAPWMDTELNQNNQKIERKTNAKTEEKSAQYPSAPPLTEHNTSPHYATEPQQKHNEQYNTGAEGLSIIEDLYAQRLLDAPLQFGYDIFESSLQTQGSNALPVAPTAPIGAVQSDYILGAGDTLTITFTGQRPDRKDHAIDARGMVFINDLPPINAAGRSIGEFKEDLNALLSETHNTKAYVSLASLRQISVLIVGNVKRPGRKTLSTFNSVLDALTLALGVKKDGSLRNIKLVRHGRSTHIDLYALLMHGAPHIDTVLKDGDRLIVPPIGPTIAISGAVKRPGIYEIKQSRYNLYNDQANHNLSLNELLKMAGGTLSTTQNRFLKLRQTEDGNETVTEINDSQKRQFTENDILSVARGTPNKSGQVELIGHTTRPGLYDVSTHKTLSALLSDKTILGHDIYPLIGVIERYDSKQLGTTYISFSPRFVLDNNFDISLRDNDTIFLLSNDDISNTYNNSEPPKNMQAPPAQGSGNNDKILQSIPALKKFIKEHSVYVRGAIRRPGVYPVADGTPLDNILIAAGGLTLDANRENIEITSDNLGQGHQKHGRSGTQRAIINTLTTPASNITLRAGDSIRVNQKYRKLSEKTVLIIGEVHHPGEYDILPGDKVSDLLARAGGITEQAYPSGSIFSRESERKAEEMRFRAAAHQMEQRLARIIESDKNKPNTTQIQMVRDLAKELSEIEAVGRITVETNPSMLSSAPELDMYLEAGDRIYIPKRPLTVRVSGEVLSPASLQFRQGKDPIDYIHEAGGFSYHADKSRTFVLYPDGSAEPLRVSNWNHTPVFIPPGSTIVVPRDPKPFDFMESAKDVGQILSNLAITSVFIDDIRD